MSHPTLTPSRRLTAELVGEGHIRSGSPFILELAASSLVSCDGLQTWLKSDVRSLNLSFNADLIEIPALPAGCDVREIQVRGCGALRALPSGVGASRLERVLASGCFSLGAFAAVDVTSSSSRFGSSFLLGMGALKALRVLRLDACGLTFVPLGLAACAGSLEEFDISDNKITSLMNLNAALPLRALTVFRCGRNHGLTTLAPLTARALPSIAELSAPDCALTDLSALDGSKTLEILDMSGNKSVGTLTAGLREGFSALAELSVAHCTNLNHLIPPSPTPNTLLLLLPRSLHSLFPLLESIDIRNCALVSISTTLLQLSTLADTLADVSLAGNPFTLPGQFESPATAIARIHAAVLLALPRVEYIDGEKVAGGGGREGEVENGIIVDDEGAQQQQSQSSFSPTLITAAAKAMSSSSSSTTALPPPQLPRPMSASIRRPPRAAGSFSVATKTNNSVWGAQVSSNSSTSNDVALVAALDSRQTSTTLPLISKSLVGVISSSKGTVVEEGEEAMNLAVATLRAAVIRARERNILTSTTTTATAADAVATMGAREEGGGRFAKILRECAAADDEGVIVPAAVARTLALTKGMISSSISSSPPPSAAALVPLLRRGGLREALHFSRLHSGASGGGDETQTTTTVEAIAATSAPNKYAMAAKAKMAARVVAVLSPTHIPRPPSSPISCERDDCEEEEEEGDVAIATDSVLLSGISLRQR